MTPEETKRYIEATAAVLEIDIREEWMANVIRFFEVAEKMASDVIASGALTDAENAPVFVPHDAVRGAE